MEFRFVFDCSERVRVERGDGRSDDLTNLKPTAALLNIKPTFRTETGDEASLTLPETYERTRSGSHSYCIFL